MPPAIATQVGNRSIVPATASLTLFGAILPGHQARVGSRTPPSQVLPLPPRSGLALPPSAPLTSHGPLSLVKTTSVCLRQLQFAQGVEHLADAPVHLLDPVAVPPVAGLAAELLTGVDRRVDRGVGEVRKNGLSLLVRMIERCRRRG